MKSVLRKVYLRKRKTLINDVYKRRNELILHHFKKHFWEIENKKIHVFLPIDEQYEVNTWPLIAHIRQNHGSVIISRSSISSNSMEHFLYDDNVDVVKNRWGIPEPVSGESVDVRDIDFVLVPLIVADKQGGRIGYGKGYYDRFLSDCRVDIKKIGLSLVPLLDKIQGLEPFDVPLDCCLYPHGIYNF